MNRTRQDPKQEPLKGPLPGLKKQLKAEYCELPDEQIDQVARHALVKYTPAKVQEFVPSSRGGMPGNTCSGLPDRSAGDPSPNS